jgi:hypothetical protein
VSTPVILFAYARPVHLRRVLECLRENGVPKLIVFADAAKSSKDEQNVLAARALLRQIDWTEVDLHERSENLGLGRNILDGVTRVAERHNQFIVWEDDLISIPGAYAWLDAALSRYAEVDKVGSVTAWTHPRVIPQSANGQPYFDGRAECWVWGTWARAWRGMREQSAIEKYHALRKKGRSVFEYGADLPVMAMQERRKNIWAVRWLYHHLQNELLCLRPPCSMIEHIGFDSSATNAANATDWANTSLICPAVPYEWPAVTENVECRLRWANANPRRWRSLMKLALAWLLR